MNKHCTHLNDLLKAEKKAIKVAIKEDKWYLSQINKEDVGWKTAERHFIKNYLEVWAAGYKAAYCGRACEDREDCEFAQPYLNDDDK